MISFLSPIKDIYGYKAAYLGDIQIWPSAKISISPQNINFDENGESVDIEVTITGTEDKSYSIIGLPSWLTVSNKTETGFTLTAPANHNTLQQGDNSVTLAVKLDNYPSYATLTVKQPRIIPTMHLDIDTSKYNGQFTFFNFPQDAYVKWGDGTSNTYGDAGVSTTPSGMASKKLSHNYNTNLGIVTATVYEIIDIPQEFAGHNNGQYNIFNGIVSIRMNDGVKYLGDKAFGFNSYLQECKLSKNLISIGNLVFTSCGKFSAELSFNQLDNIGIAAFYGTKVRSFILNSGCTIKNISSNCFSQCESLTNVILSDSVESIDDGSAGAYFDGTFAKCTTLTSFHFGTGIKYIGIYAFYKDVKLHDTNIVDVAPNIEHIGQQAFEGVNVDINNGNPILPAYEVTFGKMKTLGTMALAHNGLFSKITFSNTCELSIIPNMCFTYSFGLKGIALNNKITKIDDSTGGIADTNYGAFCCPNLQTLTGYWDKITYIGDYAFSSIGLYNTNKQILGDIAFNTLTYLGVNSFYQSSFNSVSINNITTNPLDLGSNFNSSGFKRVTLGVNDGSSMNINSFTGDIFKTSGYLTDFYYYGKTLPHLLGTTNFSVYNGGSGSITSLNIYLTENAIAEYSPTTFPEWTPMWSKVTQI